MHTPQRTQIEDDARDDVVQIVSVYELRDDDAADEAFIGTMEIDGDDYLTITEVDSVRQDLLEKTVELLNRKVTITLVADQPATEPLTTSLVTIARGSAGFRAGLRKYAEAYYGFRFL